MMRRRTASKDRHNYSLVVLSLVHLEHRREHVLDEILDLLVERDLHDLAGLPIGGVADLVERAYDLEQGLGRGFADAVVVVRQLRDELDRALLNERQEVGSRGGEEPTNRVRGNLFLNADRAVDVEQLVDVDIDVLAVEAVD